MRVHPAAVLTLLLLCGCAPGMQPRSERHSGPLPGSPATQSTGRRATLAPTASDVGAAAGPTMPADPQLAALAGADAVPPEALATRTFGFRPGDCVCTRTIVPAPGSYTLTRQSLDVLTPKAGVVPFPFAPGAQRIELAADDCGDSLVLHGDGRDVTLRHEGDAYVYDDPRVSIALTPLSSTRGTLEMAVSGGAGQTRAAWSLTHEGKTDEAAEGYARITPSIDHVNRRGPFQDVYVRFDVTLFGFRVDDATLLANHLAALDDVLRIVSDDGTPPTPGPVSSPRATACRARSRPTSRSSAATASGCRCRTRRVRRTPAIATRTSRS